MSAPLDPRILHRQRLRKTFPDILTAAGLTVERHHDLFPPAGSDEQWLEHCGTHNRIALTHNERIRYTANELAAVIRFRIRLLIVIGKTTFPMLADNFVKTLPKIEALLDALQPPYVAKVYRPTPGDLKRNPVSSGSIALWYPKS